MPVQRTRDIHSRTLEVTTDATQEPSLLKIVSPMPRAFVFPVTNNLDSPYSSRSNSPDPLSFPSTQQCTLTTSTSTSSTSSFPSPCEPLRPDALISPLQAISLQRRKSSSCGSENPERRPKKGEEDYIKRPENAFILFRRAVCEERQAAEEGKPVKKQRQADLSKTISQQWKALSSEERAKWEEMAKKKKKEHELMYPDYVYRPQRAKDKDGKTKSNKKKGKLEYDESNSLSFVIPVPRQHGRTNSEPSPPPYQAIQIPNVYQMPTSPTPSLLPMISRRSAYTGPVQDVLSSFDYIPPSQQYAPPTYQMEGQFQQALQSSEFLRSMFSPIPEHQQDTISPLQQINIPEHVDSTLQVSPSSSSGPSSPSSGGPYTPESALMYTHLSPDGASLEAQAQAAMDLQLELQEQAEFTDSIWNVWGARPAMLHNDDFDISKIQPASAAMSMSFTNSKFNESSDLGCFTGDYGHLSDDILYHDESQSLGSYIGFDDLMAGQAF